MSSIAMVGPREAVAREKYADGGLVWEDVLSARAEDEAAARAAAHAAVAEAAAAQAAAEAAAAKARADAEVAAERERAKREAPLRKRVAELRKELSSCPISKKDLAALARMKMDRKAIGERLKAENERRAALYAELATFNAELGNATEPGDRPEHAIVRLEQFDYAIETACASSCWNDAQGKAFREPGLVGGERAIRRTDANHRIVVAIVDAVHDAGGPDRRPRGVGFFDGRALAKAREALDVAKADAERIYGEFVSRRVGRGTAEREERDALSGRLDAANNRVAELEAEVKKRLEELAAQNVDLDAAG